MLEIFLVPQKTAINAKGDGPAVDISAAAGRVLLLTLHITEVVEQESLDVAIFGSADGSAWGTKSLTSFPQKFYRGQHPLLLDLKGQPEVKHLRAHWEVNRWGRGSATPHFEFHITLKEVPPDVLKDAQEQAKALV
jgi:hypothetical protein